MKISWFLGKDVGRCEGERHLFDTNGELPRVGDVLYLHDNRELPMLHPRATYKVVKAYHTVDLDCCHFNSIFGPGWLPSDALRARAEKHVMDNGDYPFEWKPAGLGVSRRTGQVILEPAYE